MFKKKGLLSIEQWLHNIHNSLQFPLSFFPSFLLFCFIQRTINDKSGWEYKTRKLHYMYAKGIVSGKKKGAPSIIVCALTSGDLERLIVNVETKRFIVST